MLNSIPAEEFILSARRRAFMRRATVNRFVLSTSMFVLLGFLAFMTWRELVSEFDASIRDFASSLGSHDRTDSR